MDLSTLDVTTSYMGMTLKSPIIIGSSGLTGNVKNMQKFEKNGAGAVVLKSFFQEEIFLESDEYVRKSKEGNVYEKFFDDDGHKSPIEFIGYKIREDNINKYVELTKEACKTLNIPVIASINCFYDSLEWVSFAKNLELAGAQGLELNMFFPPSDFKRTRDKKEEIYFKMIAEVLKTVSIPVSLKISYYFTDLGPMVKKLSETGVKGIVLFNRFFSPDFNIDKFEVVPSFVFSSPSDLAQSLRWIAIMSEKVDCDLAASTGVHDWESVVKQLLAGANAVQMASALYKKGPGFVKETLDELRSWMFRKGFNNLSDFRGKMSQEKSSDPSIYERAQFMKYYGGKKGVIS